MSEVIEVNSTLVRLQTLDDAARPALVKRSLWTTRSRGSEIDEKSLRTDNVSRYLSERKAFMDRFEKVGPYCRAGIRGCELTCAG